MLACPKLVFTNSFLHSAQSPRFSLSLDQLFDRSGGKHCPANQMKHSPLGFIAPFLHFILTVIGICVRSKHTPTHTILYRTIHIGGLDTAEPQTHAINSPVLFSVFFTWRPFKFQFVIVRRDKRLHLFDVVMARINAMPFSQSICMFSGSIATASPQADNVSFEFHAEHFSAQAGGRVENGPSAATGAHDKHCPPSVSNGVCAHSNGT